MLELDTSKGMKFAIMGCLVVFTYSNIFKSFSRYLV